MKGPWQYVAAPGSQHTGWEHWTILPAGDDIGWRGEEYMRLSGICSEADARLMAAAPTMLSAIEQFEKWWIEVGQVSFNGAPACVFALREAAAMARGES